jgi:hypothetical protein
LSLAAQAAALFRNARVAVDREKFRSAGQSIGVDAPVPRLSIASRFRDLRIVPYIAL